MAAFSNIIQTALANLPSDKKSKPWKFVNHGISLLKSEDELNCYLAAYGKMHQEKIKTAISSIDELSEILKEGYQIIDWGCGQGLATLCFLDFLEENHISNKPEKIVLIEPSQAAINRAKSFIETKEIPNCKIIEINKFLNDVEFEDVNTTCNITLNFFSNILDITSVDLQTTADVVKKNLIGTQYFFCVGPLNSNSTRIDEFASILNLSNKEIISRDSGRLNTTRGTIKLLVFKSEGANLEVIKSIYYPPMPRNKNYEHILQNLLNEVNPNELSEVDKIIQYYKLIVELERLKEPEIDKYYQYEYELSDDGMFEADLESNEGFLNIFESNRDPNKTRFPKDLIIAFRIENENRKYEILNYSYLFEDIKDINTSEEKIQINLSEFEVNYPILSSLGKTIEEIDEIEKLVKEQNSLEGVIDLFRQKIDENINFDGQLSFALSSKNIALSQIYSELKKVNTSNVLDGSLIHSFLFNQPFSNEVNSTLSENDLIQITQLDDSQKKAVLTAFNNKASVITGPPGSGKTQVISNLLANAVIQGKKVLVASKNNKAVDNVKDRFGREDEMGFFLRFGSKNHIRDTTKPEIERIINVRRDLENNEDDLRDSIDNLSSTKEQKQDCLDRLTRKDELTKQLPSLQESMESSINEMGIVQSNNKTLDDLRKYSTRQFDQFTTHLKSKRNAIQLKYSGLRKIWFNWFSKKKYAIEFIGIIDQYPIEIREYLQIAKNANPLTNFRNGDDVIKGYQSTINAFEKCIQFLKAKSELEHTQNEITEISAEETQLNETIEHCNLNIIELSKRVLYEKIKQTLFTSNLANINNYNNYIPDAIPWRFDELSEFINATENFLSIFNISCVTSLSSKSAFPLSNNLFDMVVIDEASQCDIASAIPLILRAKQLVVIGDPLQLKHITTLEDYEEEKIKEHLNLTSSVHLQYKSKSLWDYSRDFLANASKDITPKNIVGHYRCHPDIIGYSNEAYYIPKLNTQLEIHTKAEQFPIEPKGLRWIDIEGQQRANNININDVEVEKSIELATHLANQHPNISIGIVTPFKHQADELNRKLPNNLNNRVLASTVHKFQGDEKDVMIYSLVVTDNSPASKIRWIDIYAPEIVNVAVTRARNTLYIVGNKSYIQNNSQFPKPLGRLVQYYDELETRNTE